MGRKRKLTEEERELWNRVARTTRLFHGRPSEPVSMPPDDTPPAKPSSPVQPPLPERTKPDLPKADLGKLRLGGATPRAGWSHVPPHSIPETLKAQPLRMDHKAHKAMTRGKLVPDAKIDLHGMTQAEAHPELIRFILRAQDHGHRLVLVITGKGKVVEDWDPIPTRRGVLRHQVPQWLRLPPLGPVVMQVSQAHQRHGGEGAYYVYLRRLRG
ncbi:MULTISPECIES: Smr/MutS family protein [Thioclava]|uniref:Smr/MutS family protein n=1 Tax=Thioclava litoralis TaxID=3076557 RepID=A0ABZ1DV15_9RHOB|nr:Smr/MutS family protein [Thioclava sp. FTW29]